MLTDVQIAILTVVIGISALYLFYRIVLHIIATWPKKAVIIQDNRKGAFAIAGNLVQEFDATVPIIQNYRFTKTLLGRGSSAEVFVGEHTFTNHRYAIKIIDLSKKDIRWKYEREKNFLKDIEHTNVVRLFEVYNTPKEMFFVMELCTGGHLGHFVKRQPNHLLPELKAREFILQITRALMHCHEHGICHRDIKLQNILLENNSPDAQVKIVDFGNAVRFIGCTPLKKVVGTTYTAAPEVFRQHYDERCDLWSLGVVAYILLSGRRPFERVDLPSTTSFSQKTSSRIQPALQSVDSPIAPLSPAQIHQVLPPMYRNSAEGSVIASILLGRYHFHHEAFRSLSREAIYFIKTCMEHDYTHRAHARDLLAHPWLRKDFPLLFHSSLAEGEESLSPTNRRMFAYPVISPSGVETLLDASQRYFHHPTQSSLPVKKTGMRDTSMLAIAFSLPIAKIKQIRTLFQEMDRNGNGLIGKKRFYL